MIKIVNVISDTNIGGAGKCLINFCENYNKKDFEINLLFFGKMTQISKSFLL